jgi:hypothetical protein
MLAIIFNLVERQREREGMESEASTELAHTAPKK